MDLRHWIIVPLALSLFACGSGSDDERTDTVTVSISVSGTIVNEQTEVALSGTTSLQEVTSYSWSVSDADYSIVHEDDSVPAATLTTAEVRTNEEQVTLSLTATPAEGAAVTGTFVLTVRPVNIDPVASVTLSQDDRFAENTYGGALSVTFTGSGTDEDPIDADNPISAFEWQQIAGTDVVTGLDVSTDSLTITTPELAASETLSFELIVTDNEGATASQAFDIVVLDVTRTPPIAEAGNPITIMEGERFLLAGSATALSDDASPFFV